MHLDSQLEIYKSHDMTSTGHPFGGEYQVMPGRLKWVDIEHVLRSTAC